MGFNARRNNRVKETAYSEADFSDFIPELKTNMGGISTYESTLDFPYDDMEFSDMDTFKVIKSAYENVNFYGEFERGNLDSYDSYRYKYMQVLENKAPFLVKGTGEKLYLNEFGELDSHGNAKQYDLKALDFLYFDMDTDGYPELCLKGNSGFTYIFKYLPKTDKYIL